MLPDHDTLERTAKVAEKRMKRDLAKGGMRGKVLMHNEEVRLKAMFMNPDSEANKETDPKRKEARYYFDLYDVDGSGSVS
jgi:hypothetical protein